MKKNNKTFINKPKIAVLLAACNGEKYINQQVLSIIKQTIPPKSIYISLDKSTDRTEKKILNLKKKFNIIKLISKKNFFGSACSNFLSLLQLEKLKKYDFIALCDQDDVWKKNKLKVAIFKLKKKDALCYSSNIEAFWKNGKRKKIIKSQPQKKYDYFFEAAGPGCTYVLHAKFVQSFQKFLKENKRLILSLNNYHDWLIYSFARINNIKWIIDSNFSVYYRQHSNNTLGANIGIISKYRRIIHLFNGNYFNFVRNIIKLNKLNKNKFVKNWFPFSSKGFLYLAFNIRECRRKKIEQIYLFLILIAMSILTPFLKKYHE